jgi:hypothetical protein
MTTKIDWPQLISNWDSILKTSRKTIIRALRLGIPHRHRGAVWALLTKAEQTKSTASFTYESLTSGNSKASHVINLDVPRTTPYWCRKITESDQEVLRRVLNAYANADPDVGYTQGMNFIARMFLLHQPEETAFWSFYSLLHLSSFPHRLFFIDKLPKAMEITKLLTYVSETRFPKILDAFRKREFDFAVFAPQWFMVAFLSASFDMELAVFVFDQYVAYGIAPLLSFALAILDIHQHLLDEGFEALLQALANPGESGLMNDIHTVNLALIRQWVTCDEFERLKREAKIGI